MKTIFPALLGGLLAAAFAWIAHSFGATSWIAAAAAAVGGFLGTTAGQMLKR